MARRTLAARMVMGLIALSLVGFVLGEVGSWFLSPDSGPVVVIAVAVPICVLCVATAVGVAHYIMREL